MGLTAAKTYYGPINLTIKDNPSTNFTREGLKSDSLKFSVESKEGNQELEDGKEAVSYTHLTLPTILRV